MPVKSKGSATEFAVGDSVLMDLDGDSVKCKVTKIKSNGNYLVEDEEGATYECEPGEIKAAKSKRKVDEGDGDDGEDEAPKKKEKPAADEDDDEDKSAKSKVSGSKSKRKAADDDDDTEDTSAKSKVSGWNKTKAAEPMVAGFPIGSWEALAHNGAVEVNGKGIQAYIEYVGVHDDDVNGKTQRAYYTLKDDKGNWTEGVSYFKRDLGTLGFSDDELEVEEEGDNEEFAEALNKILKKLRKREPWVSIKIKDGKNGYTRLFLNGLMDDQEDKPENPLAED